MHTKEEVKQDKQYASNGRTQQLARIQEEAPDYRNNVPVPAKQS